MKKIIFTVLGLLLATANIYAQQKTAYFKSGDYTLVFRQIQQAPGLLGLAGQKPIYESICSGRSDGFSGLPIFEFSIESGFDEKESSFPGIFNYYYHFDKGLDIISFKGTFNISNTSEGYFTTRPQKSNRELSIVPIEVTGISRGSRDFMPVDFKNGKGVLSLSCPLLPITCKHPVPYIDDDGEEYDSSAWFESFTFCLDAENMMNKELDLGAIYSKDDDAKVRISCKNTGHTNVTFTGKVDMEAYSREQPVVKLKEGVLTALIPLPYFDGFTSCRIEKVSNGYQVVVCYENNPTQIARQILNFSEEQFKTIEWWDIREYIDKCTDATYETTDGQIIKIQ